MSKTGIAPMPLLGRSLSVGTPSSRATIRIALLASILLIYALVCQSRDAPLSSLVTMARQMRLPDGDFLSNSRLSEAEELLRRTDPAARQLLDMARTWPVPQAPYKLGLCAMAKNEAAYLEEWIVRRSSRRHCSIDVKPSSTTTFSVSTTLSFKITTRRTPPSTFLRLILRPASWRSNRWIRMQRCWRSSTICTEGASMARPSTQM
jgi:hypothetical protein